MNILPTRQQLPTGRALFARYAFPPNPLGHCDPADADMQLRAGDPAQLTQHDKTQHDKEFDDARPYLRAIADAVGNPDPLDAEIVYSYWVGGPLLERVRPAPLMLRLRTAFQGQATGLLDDLTASSGTLAHHSFQVFVVDPWVRSLDHDAATALRMLQGCRIRWGTVESVDDEHMVVTSQPLVFNAGILGLGAPITEQVRWRKSEGALMTAPAPGDTVAAHWDWVCGRLSPADTEALANATYTTLGLVNAIRRMGRNQ